MNATRRVLCLYPVLIGVVCGLTARLLRHWSHGDVISMALGLILGFVVWFPFSLRPYLLSRHKRG